MRMLILNYKRMKNDFLKFSSRKLFFSVMLAAACYRLLICRCFDISG